jgi:hypothetical protein
LPCAPEGPASHCMIRIRPSLSKNG